MGWVGREIFIHLRKLIHFFDETFGQSVKVEDYFDDIKKIIRSVAYLQKTVSLDLLDDKKRFRLRKHVTNLNKVSNLNKTRRGKKVLAKYK